MEKTFEFVTVEYCTSKTKPSEFICLEFTSLKLKYAISSYTISVSQFQT